MSAGDDLVEVGAIPKMSILEEDMDEDLMPVAEIDARFRKLLRMMGDDEMAEYFDLKKRFKDSPIGDVPNNQTPGTHPEIITLAKSLDSDGSVEKRTSRQKAPLKRRTKSISQIDFSKKSKDTDTGKNEGTSYDDDKKAENEGDYWITSGMHGAAILEHELYIESLIKDFFLYLIFLIVFNMIAFGILDHSFSYYASVLSEILTNTQYETRLGVTASFKEIRSVLLLWDFITGLLLKVLYEYGNTQSKTIHSSVRNKMLMLFDNILIGVPQIRQLRVRDDSCEIPTNIKDSFPTCYGYFNEENAARTPFGLGLATAWTYIEPDEDRADYVGRVSTYSGGGYTMNITENREITEQWIAELMQYSWIREGTRVLFIDFTTYTPNTNLFCVVKLVFELPPTGGVIPSSHFYTMKFLKYVNTWDHFILGCEIIFLCFVVYFTMEEIQHMMDMGWSYWSNGWNLLDVAVLVVSYVTAITSCIRYYTITNSMHGKVVGHIESSTHASFDHFVLVQMRYNTATALLTFLVWLKLLKYATLNKNVALIMSIFNRVKIELLVLTFIIIFMIFGFALLGNELFGDHVEHFATVWNSFFTIVGIFVGGFYFYVECAAQDPILSPMYFIMFIFVVLILLLNVYVAIMVHGFQRALEELEDQRDRIYLGDVCRTVLDKILRFFRQGNLATKLQTDRLAKANKRDYEELVDIIKKHGYRGLGLTILLKKHNLNPGAPVSFEKMSQIYSEIDPKNQLFLEIDEHDRISDQVAKITKRVEALDKSLVDLVAKVDSLVDQLLRSEPTA